MGGVWFSPINIAGQLPTQTYPPLPQVTTVACKHTVFLSTSSSDGSRFVLVCKITTVTYKATSHATQQLCPRSSRGHFCISVDANALEITTLHPGAHIGSLTNCILNSIASSLAAPESREVIWGGTVDFPVDESSGTITRDQRHRQAKGESFTRQM